MSLNIQNITKTYPNFTIHLDFSVADDDLLRHSPSISGHRKQT